MSIEEEPKRKGTGLLEQVEELALRIEAIRSRSLLSTR